MLHYFKFFILVLPFCLKAQENTVGLITNQVSDFGYFLFAPMSHKTTYLINREGELVHKWESEYVPGLSAVLSSDGTLYRAGRDTEATYITAGGSGGIIERYSWEGDLLWQFRYSSENERQHHDFELMPNGNVLLIAWDRKTEAEAIENGRDPSFISRGELWPDKLVEVKPTGMFTGEIVWEWHVWDHLVQDFDSTKLNYGGVSNSPGRIDINFAASNSADWIHGNAVVYNEYLDQIAFSTRSFNEIWIIDHSTTSAEAKSSSGGNAGRGGDLLYRWGNPAAYESGELADQKLFGQHGIHWYHDGSGEVGSIFAFNNGLFRDEHNYATVEKIVPAIDQGGAYEMEGGVFNPTDPELTFISLDSSEMFAPLFSNVQYLPESQNILICNGPQGSFVEFDLSGNIVWKYINPITESGRVIQQGEPVDEGSNNTVFNVTFLPADFPAFRDRILEGQGVLEGEVIVSSVEDKMSSFTLYPNPAHDQVYLEGVEDQTVILIYDTWGRCLRKTMDHTIGINDLDAGVYYLTVEGYRTKKLFILDN